MDNLGRWNWSDELGDYFRFKQRMTAGKSTYDIVWGRNTIEPPNVPPIPIASQIPIAPQVSSAPPALSTPSSAQYTSAVSFTPYTDPKSNSNNQYTNGQSFFRHTTGQLQVNQNAVSAELVQRASSPISNYHIPGPGIITFQPGLITGTSYDSSGSTEGRRTITPITGTESQSPSITEPTTELTHSLQSDDNEGLETSPIQVHYLALDLRYETIRNPQRYFRKGRVFKVLWLEPRGESIMSPTPNDQPILSGPNTLGPTVVPATVPVSEAAPTSDTPSTSVPVGSTQTVHAKPRMFVVVRQKSRHCLCLPIYTYSQQGTSKSGVNPEDHAPLVQEGADVKFHPQEQQDKLKKRLFIVVESPSIQWQPMSRINFTKVQTVEYNLKVQTVGRIAAPSMGDLESSFREGIGLNDE